ncbi:hypothetical protein TRSC58_06573 [Trypanosoma rangeli SC58]|uniref:Expression site-associated gene (ESAG-like) protein n=1 Tax=Trypanosoma rangeli SC58 TaxID=429131 RepID=A0A061IUL5_TRYRA|nr:hypothetical protein TRSC58_06573 [Trypanosoma rangeli SC58]
MGWEVALFGVAAHVRRDLVHRGPVVSRARSFGRCGVVPCGCLAPAFFLMRVCVCVCVCVCLFVCVGRRGRCMLIPPLPQIDVPLSFSATLVSLVGDLAATMHFSPPPGLVRRTLRKHRRQLLLCAVVVAMALLTLILVSKGAALQRRLFSPTQSSAWARSATAAPRAVFIVAQTSYSPGWCRMMLSAILSNVSVVSIGLGGKYKHSVRPAWLLDYMDDAGLRDEDVVVMFDGGDTFFTGPLGVKRAVEGFLATTAPSADAFNATAVHQGEATAPLLFESDPACWAPQIDLVVPLGPEDHFSRCFWYYERVWKAANSSPGQRLVRPPPWEYRHLAAGGMVGRVWAFREASKAYANLFGEE